MEAQEIQTIATLRAVVGYLGERDQAGWWTSTFFTAGSSAFLAPVFGRTQMLARCTGVTRAAAVVHDERIGVGYVYHLFRLPEDMEQRIHVALHEPDLARAVAEAVSSRDQALGYLRRQGARSHGTIAGPIRAGDRQEIRSMERWGDVATRYLDAFESGVEVYPYFTGRA